MGVYAALAVAIVVIVLGVSFIHPENAPALPGIGASARCYSRAAENGRCLADVTWLERGNAWH
jgi:hypothetical protein